MLKQWLKNPKRQELKTIDFFTQSDVGGFAQYKRLRFCNLDKNKLMFWLYIFLAGHPPILARYSTTGVDFCQFQSSTVHSTLLWGMGFGGVGCRSTEWSLVGVERFELPALWSQTRCATRLRYTPTLFSYPSLKRISSIHRARMSIYLIFAQWRFIASDYNGQMQTRPYFYV